MFKVSHCFNRKTGFYWLTLGVNTRNKVFFANHMSKKPYTFCGLISQQKFGSGRVGRQCNGPPLCSVVSEKQTLVVDFN